MRTKLITIFWCASLLLAVFVTRGWLVRCWKIEELKEEVIVLGLLSRLTEAELTGAQESALVVLIQGKLIELKHEESLFRASIADAADYELIKELNAFLKSAGELEIRIEPQ